MIVANIKEHPERYSWWISELKSLGIKIDDRREELKDMQAAENFTDDVKQTFIRYYNDQLQ